MSRAYLRADDSALPDLELARALRPALLTLNGLLFAISSPHRKIGLLYEAHRKYFGNDTATRGLYIQAQSRQLNPLLDEEAVEEAMQDDPAAAQSEYLGLFRADLQGFLDDATVDGAIIPNRRMLPRSRGCSLPRHSVTRAAAGTTVSRWAFRIPARTASGAPDRARARCPARGGAAL